MEGYNRESMEPEGLYSPKALELYRRIENANREELVEILVEALTAKMHVVGEEMETEITSEEYGYIIFMIDYRLNQMR